jgi:hypothetical protein
MFDVVVGNEGLPGRGRCIAAGENTFAPGATASLNLGQLGLQREFGNLGTLDLDVTVCDLVQLDRGRRLFILRQARPAANTLGKRTRAIDVALFNQGSFGIPRDVGHVAILT